MDLKQRISEFLQQILTEYSLKQKDLANMLDVGLGSFAAYLKGKELPRVDVLMKIAEIGGVTMDELLKTDKGPTRPKLSIVVNNKKGTVGAVAGGDIHNVHVGNVYNTTRPPAQVYKYVYEPGDLTEEQAAKIKELVDQIVELEGLVMKKGKTHAAVYSTLKRRFKVAYYRKIGEENFETVIKYLIQWRGNLRRNQKYPKIDPDKFRAEMYGAIHKIGLVYYGWKHKEITGYVFDQFGVLSLADLSNEQLTTVRKMLESGAKKKK
jgi:transcriptional regulator with XRE-family HTH domain